MAASRVGYVNMEVVDARTLHTSGVAAVDWLVSVWAVSILGLCGEGPLAALRLTRAFPKFRVEGARA